MEKIYSVKNILSERQAESLLSKLVYSIEGISGCYLHAESCEIRIDVSPQCDVPALESTLSRMIESERQQRIVGTRLYRQSADRPARGGKPAPSRELDFVFADNGRVRRDAAVTLFDELDGLFAAVALKRRAQLRNYPAMIPVGTLEKCRYIQSFPQNIHFVAEIPHRLEALEGVKRSENIAEITRISPYALSPAVCFHCYEELSGSRLDEPLVLTARGTCFRHEAPWRLGKHRLNEFGMREIVLFGDEAYVESARKACMDEVWTLFEALGLRGRIETASDPFYFSEDSPKGQHQRMANMKYELVVEPGGGQGEFSIASFNHMGESLCRPFDVRDAHDAFLNSGCIAFGIDRWLYALLLVHGADFSLWPSPVRAVLRERSEHEIQRAGNQGR